MTAMAVTSITDYRDRVAGLPADRFVGSLVWYSITGLVEHGPDNKRTQVRVRLTHDQLEAWFQDLGLEQKFLPPRIKKVDAFRRASSAVRREWDVGDEKKSRLRVEEIQVTEEFVLRHVILDNTDSRGQVQVSAKVAELKFFRGSRTSAGKNQGFQHYKHSIRPIVQAVGLDGKPAGQEMQMTPEVRAHIDTFLKDLNDKYTDMAANLHSDAIRAMIRNYVVSLNAIQCKPGGGVYFVHMTKQDEINALQKLVQRIGQGCQFHIVPLLDTAEQRDMLTEAFQSEVEDECYGLLKEIAELNEKAKTKKKVISPARYAALKAQFDSIVSRSEEYTNILGLSQGRSAAALELALDGVFDLAERVEA